MHFEWDEAKRAANLAKHGLDFADIGQMNWEAVTILEDDRFAYSEKRYWAFGLIGDRLHLVSFARRGETIRIISFRRASRKERKRYGSSGP